ncbi:MAG: YdeI/OmpD-associated family protein [Nonlabens sp.]
MVFEFEATLGTDGFMGALLIPEDIVSQLAQDKIKRVVAHVTYKEKSLKLHAGILKKKGVVYLMFSKAKRKHLQVGHGDTLSITMSEDTSKYQAPMTEELEAVLLSDYEAYEIFEKLLPGKQRNIIFSVYNITDSQKRVDKALNAMENLKLGNRDPFKFDRSL